MTRVPIALVLAATCALAAPAAAQEVGAGRVEFGVGTAGGVLLIDGSNGVSRFGEYAVGATVTFNLKPRLGVETDFGFAGGRKQDLVSGAGLAASAPPPTMLNYNAALIFNVIGHQHRAFPYLAAGVGGLTMLHAPETADLGLTTTRTFFTGDVGGGVNWFAWSNVGFRADYRLLLISNGANAPILLGQGAVHVAHRIYGGLILTF